MVLLPPAQPARERGRQGSRPGPRTHARNRSTALLQERGVNKIEESDILTHMVVTETSVAGYMPAHIHIHIHSIYIHVSVSIHI